MAKYRKLPVEIEAVELSWPTWNEVCAFVGPFVEGMRGVYVRENGTYYDGDGPPTNSNHKLGFTIPTLEGIMLATEGDYIIRGVQGELYPCKPDIFEKTYELVE